MDATSSPSRLRRPLTVGNYLAVFFCTLYSGVILSDNLPPSLLKTQITQVTAPITQGLGVWQRWDMFYTGQITYRNRYRFTYSDGRIVYRDTAVTTRVPQQSTVYANSDFSVALQNDPSYATALATYQCKQEVARGKELPQSIAVEGARAYVPRLNQPVLGPNPSTDKPLYVTVATVSCLQ
jgi:hypothetical protein